MTDKEKTDKLKAFIGTLSDSEVRQELLLAYLMMERCKDVMEGKDIEPVTMKENGLDSDLELFFMCKKLKQDNDWLDAWRKKVREKISDAITVIDETIEKEMERKAAASEKRIKAAEEHIKNRRH